jgi:hypothetical protein
VKLEIMAVLCAGLLRADSIGFSAGGFDTNVFTMQGSVNISDNLPLHSESEQETIYIERDIFEGIKGTASSISDSGKNGLKTPPGGGT